VTALPIVIGILVILLGLAGAVGLLDRSRVKLYRSNRPAELGPQHTRMQRTGGAVLAVIGVLFIVWGLRR
jgi:uncharacterized iron-regulated membrane protein